MPVQDLNFLGINRAISDYSPSSACEELINLRPSVNGLVPVMPFGTKMGNTSYQKIYIHVASNKTNYIGVKIRQSVLSIDVLTESGEYSSTLFTAGIVANLNVNLTVDDIHFAYASNVILFSICDRTDNYYKTLSYTWDSNSYIEHDADIPTISASITTLGLTDIKKETSGFPEDNLNSIGAIEDVINNTFNQIQEENPDSCFGPIVIAIAFKTTSGQTFWTDKWFVHDPTLYIISHPTPADLEETFKYYYSDVSELPSMYQSFYVDYFTKYAGYGGFRVAQKQGPADKGYVYFRGVKLRMTIPQLTSGSWDKDKSIISSIEIYASRPKLYVDERAFSDGIQGFGQDPTTTAWMCLLPRTPYNDLDMQSVLLYHQQSISMEALMGAAQTVDLRFGGNTQVGEDTLDVDAGAVTRYGKVMAYNARFHYYDSVSATSFTMPDFVYSSNLLHPLVTTDVCVKYIENGKDYTIYIGQKSLPQIQYFLQYKMLIAPSVNITEVLIHQSGVSTGNNFVRFSMMGSTNYNYSIWADGASYSPSRIEDSDWNSQKVGFPVRSITAGEDNEINVTEQYSPFVFLVEHSYYAPGKVLEIQPQMAQDRDTTFGPYPLNVFTTRGVYALMQGSSNVLYGSFWPVSNHVSDSNSISTEIGTFYIAAGGIWLVAGMHATLISVALSLGPHKYIRYCDGFQKLSMGEGLIAGTYSVSSALSAVSFKDYLYREYTEGGQTLISKATLSYNRFQEELYVSNPDYDYTYVLSVKYRQWFKISGSIWQDVPGSTVANRPGSSPLLMNIVDFAKENDAAHVIVHLQSRPVTFGMQYTHIHRIVTMIRSELGFNENLSYQADTLIVALYGSDNLQDWNLLTYSQRAGTVETVESTTTRTPLKVSQVRTPSAARSWRYYTLCIGGRVQKDTDLGQVLVDYEPVVRRIG